MMSSSDIGYLSSGVAIVARRQMRRLSVHCEGLGELCAKAQCNRQRSQVQAQEGPQADDAEVGPYARVLTIGPREWPRMAGVRSALMLMLPLPYVARLRHEIRSSSARGPQSND
jgi:hypothetical protein